MLEKYITNFQDNFDKVVSLIIKFVIEIQNYMKTNDEKFIKYFSNVYCDLHYHLAKS
jgi:hypothetical protein